MRCENCRWWIPVEVTQADADECPACVGTGSVQTTSDGPPTFGFTACPDCQSSSDMVEAMAAKDAEIARLSSDNEGLREMLRVVEDPDRQLCCSGHGCGCMGSTVGQYAAWAFRDTAAKDAQLAELRAEVERLRGEGAFLLARIDELDWSLSMEDFSREHAGHVDPAIARFRAALGSAEG